jgi:sulfur-oxidizing protein SoxY
LTRRALLAGGASVILVPVAGREALATREEMAAAIAQVVGSRPVKEGRVRLEAPELAENGNSVPITVTVDSPMTAGDHVRTIHVFSEANPIATVVRFHLGPRAGRAKVSTSIRLAETQRITALAEMSDGSFWSGHANVLVTLAACIDTG